MVSNQKNYLIQNAGGTFDLEHDITTTHQYQLLYVYGTATLVAGMAFTPVAGTPAQPTRFIIYYNGNVTQDAGNYVSFAGVALTNEQALKGKCIIEIIYDFVATAWVVSITEGFQTAINDGVDTTALNPAGATAVSITKNSKQVHRLTGVGLTALGGNVTTTTSGAFFEGQPFMFFLDFAADMGAFSVNILGATLTKDQCLGGPNAVIAYYSLGAAAFLTFVITNPKYLPEAMMVPVSFETGEVCKNIVIAPCNGYFTDIDAAVVKLIEATDDATITPAIGGVAVTNMDITLPGGSALDTIVSNTPTAANTFTRGAQIAFTAAKTTKGGKALVTARFIRTG